MAELDRFLSVIVKHGGSDLHIGEGQPPKMRVHGDIIPIRDEPISHEEATRMLSEVCGPRNWEALEQRGDLDFAYEMDEASRFRSNYFKQSNGYGATFRLIPTKIATLEELGIPLVVKELVNVRGGLVLITGPTGSGKTTTQAALVDHINQNFAKHVVTIEEPIEFVHNNKESTITQREVPGDSTADRQPQARAMLANSLRGVVAQLLLKRADRPGRIAVNEILIANAAVAAIIREGATQKLQDVIVSGKAQGMQFMDDAIWELLEKGIVSPHEAFMKAIDKNRFKPFLSPEEEPLANAAGSVPDDEKRVPGNFVKPIGARARAGTR